VDYVMQAKIIKKRRVLILIAIFLTFPVVSHKFNLPEVYQDVIIQGRVVQQGVRLCNDRYEAIRKVLHSLPRSFKSLDIGASQGYFSFRMAQDFNARCTMMEDSYAISGHVWHTGDYLRYLCEKNFHLANLTLLQKKVFASDLTNLKKLEEFDLVLAFSVIHHMKKSSSEPHEVYLGVIDAILSLAPVVLIENPINTGEHTRFIRKALQERGGQLIYSSSRGSLIYEIYLFDNRVLHFQESGAKNLKKITYRTFNGTYSTVQGINCEK